MNELLEWLSANQDALISVLEYTFAIATVVTGLTRSSADNEWLNTIKKALTFLSILTPKDVKGTFKLPLTPIKK